jgi:hypothetical protein
MTVYVASYEFNVTIPSSQDGSFVLGVTLTKRSAWKICARDWRLQKELQSGPMLRYGEPRSQEDGDRDDDNWDMNYFVDEFEVQP